MTAATWEAIWKDVILFLPRLPVSAVILIAFWLGGKLVEKAVARFGTLRRIDPNLILFVGRAAKTVLIVLGAVTALGTIGVDVSSLVAGLGLTGFALGFALKDMISNVLSGIMIIIYKPFSSGNHITMTPLEGTVVEVNLRYTVLEAVDGKRVFIPNSMLFTTPVVVEKPQPPAQNAWTELSPSLPARVAGRDGA